jgi:nitroimidazol reductase NimA-like FMN-containing flavoprotein (pyridoxamine 5'-phosphate oxidase superfamily)
VVSTGGPEPFDDDLPDDRAPSGPSALADLTPWRDDGHMDTVGQAGTGAPVAGARAATAERPRASAGLVELTPEESYALLASVPVGRVVYTDHALPAIQPVNFVLDGPDVVFRTAEGSKLAVAASRAVVAFEVDWFDAEARSGWSVVLVGRTFEVTEPVERQRLLDLPLVTFVPGVRDRVIKVVPRIVTGRRIVR